MTEVGAGEHALPSAAAPLPYPQLRPTERRGWADSARLVSIFAVVMLHVAAPLVARYRVGAAASWWTGNLYDSAVRWCVPLFVMLSGALLLGRGQPARGFIRRRLRRVALPFAAWSAIYAAFAVWHRGAAAPSWRELVEAPAYYHLWFFYMLIGLYLVAPILDIYLRGAHRRDVAYLLGLWLAWASLLPLFEHFAGFELFASGGTEHSPLRFVGYFVLGWVLRDVRLGIAGRLLAAGAFAVALAGTAAGTYLLTRANGDRLEPILYEYWSPNVAVMSVSLFLLVKGLPSGGWALRRTSALVLGVYLVHAMVLDLVRSGRLGFELEATSLHPALGVPLLSLTVFAISLAAAALLHSLPLVRRIVP